jgi:hypothetical protein
VAPAEPVTPEAAPDTAADVGPTDDTPTAGTPTVPGPAVDAPTVEQPAPDAPTGEAPTSETAAEAPTVEQPVEPTTPMASAPADPTTPIEPAAVEPEPTAVEAPSPTEPDGAGSGGGTSSTTRIAIGVGLVAVVAIILAVVVLAGGDSSGSSAKAKVADVLESQDHLTHKDATCVADHVVDALGASRLDGVKDFNPATPPQDLATDLPSAVSDGVVQCHVDTSKIPAGGPLTSGTNTTSPLGVADPGEVGSLRDLLANQYETGFHLSKEKADCLAKAMTDAISSGKVAQGDAASSDFFTAFLDACHVSLDDLAPPGG